MFSSWAVNSSPMACIDVALSEAVVTPVMTAAAPLAEVCVVFRVKHSDLGENEYNCELEIPPSPCLVELINR